MLTASEISAHIMTAMNSLEVHTLKSGNLKGGYIKLFKAIARWMKRAAEEYRERVEEESGYERQNERVLELTNDVLTLRKEKMALEKKLRRVRSAPSAELPLPQRKKVRESDAQTDPAPIITSVAELPPGSLPVIRQPARNKGKTSGKGGAVPEATASGEGSRISALEREMLRIRDMLRHITVLFDPSKREREEERER